MLSSKVKSKQEASELLSKSINYHKYGRDWRYFSRTAFESIARKINQHVNQQVLDQPSLVEEHLIIGQDEMESLFFRQKMESLQDFYNFIEHQNSIKPFNWICGKTLQSYWNGGNPKDKKYNVLLAFLEIPVEEWDEWKQPVSDSLSLPFDRTNTNLLKRHYLGCYFRYYQRSDESKVIVKTPLIIREDTNSGVIVETKTVGHRYRSTYVAMRDGALYIDCENIDWNEKENHIYNIGFETNPEVIVGISNTLNSRKQAIALRNILVRQSEPFDYSSMEVVEIPYDSDLPEHGEEKRIIDFFRETSCNILRTTYMYSLDELLPQRH
ncbi:MAG: hypothetical protein P8X57_06780 [Cyclobacteriaceae bacterium]